MKILRFTMLAIVMVFGLFAGAVFAAAGEETKPTMVVQDSGPSVSKQVPNDNPVNAVVRVDAICQMPKAWVRTRVGAMPLNVFRSLPAAAVELDGYRDIAIKPKIDSNVIHSSINSGYRGFGHNHFARADV